MVRLADGLLRRSRAVILLALVLLAGLAWWWILTGAGMGMAPRATFSLFPHRSAEMMTAMPWTASRLAISLAMWWVMMVAMMVPAAAPVVLLYSRSAPQPHSGHFLSGYLVVWLGFSAIAVALQWLLESSGLLTSMGMSVSNRWLAGGVLVLAGLYQLGRWKDVCLSHCRNPAKWLSEHFRPGPLGALQMGLAHGSYCVGCCWVLMALLFVGGVMNIVWVAALTIIVAAEKLLPGGQAIARVLGLLFLGWGALVLVAG